MSALLVGQARDPAMQVGGVVAQMLADFEGRRTGPLATPLVERLHGGQREQFAHVLGGQVALRKHGAHRRSPPSVASRYRVCGSSSMSQPSGGLVDGPGWAM